MRGRRRRRRDEFSLMADVNMTNLVDVALVLLIIFMITAPIMQGGIQVQLPRAQARPIESSQSGVTVSVAADGKIYVGEVPVSNFEEFQRLYPQYIRGKGLREAYLRADSTVPYGRVLQVLGMMKKLDVAEVGLVAEPQLER
ncbi:MAG TPA: biopolymer transporter ExbD [Longimicrobiales bacterium]